MITLVTHIPSHIDVAGNRVLVLYDGQTMTCYGCNDTGHLYRAWVLRQIAGEGTHIHPYILGKYSGESDEEDNAGQ